MEQLEVNIHIVYRWWEVNKKGVITKRHLQRLKIIANHFLADQIKLGFTSGNMPTERMDDQMYTGYWEINETQKEE